MNAADAWNWIINITATIEGYVLDLSESLWIYPGVFGLSLLDGFFPIVPSESVIIATATASSQTGNPLLALIFICGAAGAWCGDQIAYFIGSRVDVRKWKLFRGGRALRSLDWAESQLERRSATFIVAARFIPMGRMVVNLSAGALRFPHTTFMALDAVAVSLWAAWSVALGTVAAALFPEDNLLLSIVVGVIAGVVLGFFVDKVMTWLGFEAPELPDIAGDIEESLTPEERKRVAELAAERDARRELLHERLEHFSGSIPIRKREETSTDNVESDVDSRDER